MKAREIMTFAMVVTVAAIAGVVTLVALGKDPSALLYIFGVAAVPALGVALGSIHAKVTQTAENTNGRMSQLTDANQEFQRRLLDMIDKRDEQMTTAVILPPANEGGPHG